MHPYQDEIETIRRLRKQYDKYLEDRQIYSLEHLKEILSEAHERRNHRCTPGENITFGEELPDWIKNDPNNKLYTMHISDQHRVFFSEGKILYWSYDTARFGGCGWEIDDIDRVARWAGIALN